MDNDTIAPECRDTAAVLKIPSGIQKLVRKQVPDEVVRDFLLLPEINADTIREACAELNFEFDDTRINSVTEKVIAASCSLPDLTARPACRRIAVAFCTWFPNRGSTNGKSPKESEQEAIAKFLIDSKKVKLEKTGATPTTPAPPAIAVSPTPTTSVKPVLPIEEDVDGTSLDIDPALEALVPRPIPSQLAALEASLLEHGQEQPVHARRTDQKLFDGFTRARILIKLGKPIRVRWHDLPEDDDLRERTIRYAVERRNMTRWQLVQCVPGMLLIEKDRALARQRAGKRLSDLPVILPEGGEAKEIIAERIGLSRKLIDQGLKLLECASPELLTRLDNEEIFISAAYEELFPRRSKCDLRRGSREDAQERSDLTESPQAPSASEIDAVPIEAAEPATSANIIPLPVPSARCDQNQEDEGEATAEEGDEADEGPFWSRHLADSPDHQALYQRVVAIQALLGKGLSEIFHATPVDEDTQGLLSEFGSLLKSAVRDVTDEWTARQKRLPRPVRKPFEHEGEGDDDLEEL